MSKTKTELERMEEVYAKHPGIGRTLLMRLSGARKYGAEKFLHEKKGSCAGVEPTKGSTISVKSFVEKFDYAGLLRKTINRLCRREFVSDTAMRAESGIPPASFRLVAEQPEFKECQFKSREGTWWSTKSNIELVRKEAHKWGVKQ